MTSSKLKHVGAMTEHIALANSFPAATDLPVAEPVPALDSVTGETTD